MPPANTHTVFEFSKIEEPSQWLLVGAGVLVLIILVRWIYRRDSVEMSWSTSWLVTLLRVLVLLLVGWVFLEPQLRTEDVVVRHARTLLLFDVSQSMSIRDRSSEETSPGAEPPSRAERLVQAMEDLQVRFLDRLRQRNDVVVYRFGRNLDSAAKLPLREAGAEEKAGDRGPGVNWKEILSPESDETRIGEAMATLLRRETMSPIAAVILFSDGRNNAGISTETAIAVAARAGTPIHAVPVGTSGRPRNIRVAKLQAPTHAYVEDSIPLTAYVQGMGFSGGSCTIELLRAADAPDAQLEVIETRDVSLDAENEPVPVTFNQQHKATGKFLYVARVPVQKGELLNEDNEQSAWVNIVDRKVRVLLFASGPTREYQFARIVLFRDKTVELSIFLQTMDTGGSQEAEHLLEKFPEPDKLAEYDAVVAFDPNYRDLTEEQNLAINNWVFSEGGGLIAVAGHHHTPDLLNFKELAKIRELYPVSFGSALEVVDLFDRGAEDSWPLEISDAGRASPAIRLADDAQLSHQLWAAFKGVNRCFPVKQEKPGAVVLARFTDPRAQNEFGLQIYMAEQFFGSGRCFYIGSGEMWRLRALDEKLFARLWVGLIRYVTQGRLLRGSSKGFLMVDRDTSPVGTAVRIRARLRDSALQPLVLPLVPLNLAGPESDWTELALSPEEGRPGWYLGEFRPRKAGIHRIELTVPGTRERVEKAVTATAPNLEYDDPRRNDALLDELTQKTGGQRVGLDDLARLAEAIRDRSEEEVISGNPVTLWDRTWVMLAAVALLSLEWILRKLNNLA